MDKLVDLLRELAVGLGTTADKLYPIFIKQAYIDGIIGILFTVIYILGIVACIKLIKYGLDLYKENQNTYADDGCTPIIIGIMVGIILFITLCFTISDTITAFANPQYYALKNIIDQISSISVTK
jgi:hypothetical protein